MKNLILIATSSLTEACYVILQMKKKKKNAYEINSNLSVTFSQHTSLNTYYNTYGFPRWRLPMQEVGSIPGSGRFPGGGHGNPLQYSCLENPMDRGARWVSVRRVTKSRTGLKQLIRG